MYIRTKNFSENSLNEVNKKYKNRIKYSNNWIHCWRKVYNMKQCGDIRGSELEHLPVLSEVSFGDQNYCADLWYFWQKIDECQIFLAY